MKLRIGNQVALHAEPLGRGTIIDYQQRSKESSTEGEESPWLVEWDDFASSWHNDQELKVLL